MKIARWQFTAEFGRKQEAIELMEEWNEQIGSQTNIDMSNMRLVTGSVGASEGLVESEMEIENLQDLEDFFTKKFIVNFAVGFGPKMGDVIVSGSTRWEIFNVL